LNGSIDIKSRCGHKSSLFGIHAIAAFVHPFTSDGAVEHPRTDWLRVDERMPWQACVSGYQQMLKSQRLK